MTEADIQTFVDQGNAPFVFCLDKERESYEAYGGKTAPALCLIDEDGRVAVSSRREHVEEWVRQLLAH